MGLCERKRKECEEERHLVRPEVSLKEDLNAEVTEFAEKRAESAKRRVHGEG
jgi:hypothetical protein